MLNYVLILATLLFSYQAFAADTLPVANLEAKTTGKVSSANLLKPGQFALGLLYHGTDSPVPSAVAPEGESVALSGRVHQVGAVVGIGIAKFLELHLGVHGTSENIVDEHNRQYLFTRADDDEAIGGSTDSKSTAFSGVSGLAKFRLVDMPGIKLAVAPFIKSGAGSSARQSISRSEAATGGWMVIGTYGARGVAEINLNGGYRYRDKEQLGDWTLRNEMFYQGSVEAYIVRHASVFVGAQGRRIKVSDNSEQLPGAERRYDSLNSGEFLAGVAGDVKGFDMSLYGGSRFRDESLGSGRSVIGFTIGYTFQGRSRSAPSSMGFGMAEDDDEDSDEAEQESLENWNPKPSDRPNPDYKNVYGGAYYDIDGKKSDMYSDIDKVPEGAGSDYAVPEDDFAKVKKKIQAEAKRKGPTEDEIVEAELRKLREAEARTAKENQKANAAEMKSMRQERLQEARSNDKQLRKLRREVKEETEELPDISDEEVRWDGLN